MGRPPMFDAETAWLAGLFDGEGTINTPKHGYQVILTLEMNDADLVQRAAAVAGVGTARTSRGGSMWVWKVSKAAESVAVLRRLLPWLGERRTAKALEAIARYEQNFGLLPPHGTTARFQRELHDDDGPCRECREAIRSYRRAYYLSRKVG